MGKQSAHDAFLYEQLKDGLGADFGTQPLEHLPTATTGLGRCSLHTVGAALGLDHFEALGSWLGGLQQRACE